MANHGYLGEPPRDMIPKHTYKCPRLGCKYETTSYTLNGMMRLADEYRAQHKREDDERSKSYVFIPKTPKEYEVMNLTPQDLGFLKTRGIKVDHPLKMDYSNPKPVDGRDYPWFMFRSRT